MAEEPENVASHKHIGGPPTVVTDDVVEEVAECLARRMRKHEIKRHMEELLGFTYSIASHEKMLRLARALLVERSARPKSEHLALSIEFWEKMLRDETSSSKDKMRAQCELQELLGIGGRFGGTSELSPDDRAELLRKSLRAMDDTAVPDSEEPSG